MCGTGYRAVVRQPVGLIVIPWTASSLDEAARLVAAGVDGLITDRPDLIVDN